jgi:predicted Zn-dependent peptidase
LIEFTKFSLGNGLTVIHHEDKATELCVLNLLYKVGSKNEEANKTGFAHLFEHLMFGGSIHIPNYDEPLQLAGGENNAYTSNDITNYYLSLPANNLETGFWLESDRMLGLAINPKSLKVQKGVVIEEFKERYLNQPYGDIWLKLLPLAYKKHPYKWPTIGKAIAHIKNANQTDVNDFFKQNYAPNNCILVVAGNINLEKTKELCNKWFLPIPSQNILSNPLPQEPVQRKLRRKTVLADVPANLIVMSFHMDQRQSKNFYAMDLLSDIMGSGKGSILYQELIKKKNLFSEIDAYITADAEPGLFIIEGRMLPNTTFEMAEEAIWIVLNQVKSKNIDENDLKRAQHKNETSIRFGDINPLNRAMKLAYAEYLGDVDLVNKEIDNYLAIHTDDIVKESKKVFKESNCSILSYKIKKDGSK